MKLFFRLFIAIIFTWTPCLGQQRVPKLQGHVINAASGRAVEGVMVTVQRFSSRPDESLDRILGYGITGEDGSFSIILQDCPDSLRITASSLMTRKAEVVISSDEAPVTIKVEEEIQRLMEVKVTASKIERRGDTLDYNVASFADVTDRSIGDVLKKLPGIQVLDSGKILYQGTEINKFYIEGLDMLQGRYGIATRNIDASKVASVQVLEHHQPIKVLRNSDIPEAAAINLKLRHSALGAFFLTAQIGAGIYPLLLNEELQGMRFTNKQQNLMLYKYDNTGRDIVREMTSFYGSTASQVLNVFQIDGPSAPALDQQHYLFNNAHIGSVNNLFSLGDSCSMMTNLHFLYDRQRRNSLYEKTVYLPGETALCIREDLSSSLLKRELSGTATLEKNREDSYLENRIDVDARWNSTSTEIVSTTPVEQRSALPSVSIEDNFKMINRTRLFNAQLMYTQQNHALTATPVNMGDMSGGPDSVFTQQLWVRQFQAAGQYRCSWTVSRSWDFRILGGGNIHYTDFRSNLFNQENIAAEADSLANDLRKGEYSADLSIETNYRKRPFSAMIAVPLHLRVIDLDNRITGNHQVPVYLLPAPYGYVEFNKRSLTFRLNARWNTRLADITDELTGYLMQSYRRFNRNEGVQPRSDIAEAWMGIHYRDAETALFLSLMGGYGHRWQNTIANVNYTGIISRTERIEYPNQGDQVWASLSAGTELPFIRSTFKFQVEYRSTRSLALYQGCFMDYSIKQLRVNPFLSIIPTKWMALQYELLWLKSQSGLRDELSGEKSLPAIHYINQNASLTLTPLKGLSVVLKGHHYFNNNFQGKQSVWFATAGISYKLPRVEFLLDWTNIFNTREFVSFSYDDISSYYSVYTLRPSEILLRVKFTIL